MATIKEALKNILETEMVPGAPLAELKTVHIEGMQIFPNEDYPLVSIEYEPSKFSREGKKLEIERNYTLILHVIEPNIQDAEELRDRLVLNEDAQPMTGIIAAMVLMKNYSITVGNTYYDVIMGDVKVGTGVDLAKRNTAVAEIPIMLKTWKSV